MRKMLFVTGLAMITMVVFCCVAYAQDLVPTKHEANNVYGYKVVGEDAWSLLPKYSWASSFRNRVAIVSETGLDYAINVHGERISPFFEDLAFCMSGYAAKYIGNDYRLCDLSFNQISQTTFLSFEEAWNMTIVETKSGSQSLWGTLDAKGNIQIPSSYIELRQFFRAKHHYPYSSIPESLNIFDFSQYVFLACNQERRYGVIGPDNQVLVPFKYKTGYDLMRKGLEKYKQQILDYMASESFLETKQHLENVYKEMESMNQPYIAQLPEKPFQLSPVDVVDTGVGYSFMRDGKAIDNLNYSTILLEGKHYIVELDGKYGIKDLYAQDILKTEYDVLLPWNETEQGCIYLVAKGNNYQLYNDHGKALLDIPYAYISDCLSGRAIVMNSHGFRLIDANGNLLSRQFYDDMDISRTTGVVTVKRMGKRTQLDTQGKESPSIANLFFDEAYNSNNNEVKIDRDRKVIQADEENVYGLRGKALNNLGLVYEEKGDIEGALSCYQQGMKFGSENAKGNASRVKSQIRQEKLEKLSNALNQLSQALGNSGSGTQTVSSQSAGYTSSETEVSSSGSGGHSLDFYQSNYDRWEKVARMAYETLTNTGYKTKDKNGKNTGGGSAGSFSPANYTSLKRNLRNAQKEMRECRQKASRDGYKISQSEYETVTVSY